MTTILTVVRMPFPYVSISYCHGSRLCFEIPVGEKWSKTFFFLEREEIPSHVQVGVRIEPATLDPQSSALTTELPVIWPHIIGN